MSPGAKVATMFGRMSPHILGECRHILHVDATACLQCFFSQCLTTRHAPSPSKRHAHTISTSSASTTYRELNVPSHTVPPTLSPPTILYLRPPTQFHLPKCPLPTYRSSVLYIQVPPPSNSTQVLCLLSTQVLCLLPKSSVLYRSKSTLPNQLSSTQPSLLSSTHPNTTPPPLDRYYITDFITYLSSPRSSRPCGRMTCPHLQHLPQLQHNEKIIALLSTS